MNEWMKEFLVQTDVDRIEEITDQFEDRMDAALTDLLEGLADEDSRPHPVGWECPKCGRCYAPEVKRCWMCRHHDSAVLRPYVWYRGNDTGDYQAPDQVITTNHGDPLAGGTCLYGSTA